MQIHKLNSRHNFTQDEAIDIVNLLLVISSKSKKELDNLNSQLAGLKDNKVKSAEIQDKINDQLCLWSDNVRRLGGIPISLFKVRLAGDDIRYRWEYPNTALYMD